MKGNRRRKLAIVLYHSNMSFKPQSLLLLLVLACCQWKKGVHALSSMNPQPPNDFTSTLLLSRSEAIRAVFFTMSTSTLVMTQPSSMAQAATEEKTIYISGKTPKVPGAKPKDKNDLSGTKKDPNFLRSIADCKSQCESKGKTKEDCLSECQDICCTTYEQVSKTVSEGD